MLMVVQVTTKVRVKDFVCKLYAFVDDKDLR